MDVLYDDALYWPVGLEGWNLIGQLKRV